MNCRWVGAAEVAEIFENLRVELSKTALSRNYVVRGVASDPTLS
jgi:hypothetical protein